VIEGGDIGRDDPTGVHTAVPASGTSIPRTRRPKNPFGNPAPQGA
jgi:cell division protease FtsH